jgi:hypothetical protein
MPAFAQGSSGTNMPAFAQGSSGTNMPAFAQGSSGTNMPAFVNEKRCKRINKIKDYSNRSKALLAY